MYGRNGRQYVQGYMPAYLQGKTALCTMVERETDNAGEGDLYSIEWPLHSRSGMIINGPLQTQM